PDVFDISAVGGSNLFYASFANYDARSRSGAFQSFPDTFPGGRHAAQTGAVEKRTLGYDPLGAGDAVYHLVVPFAHSNSTLTVNFSAGLQGAASSTAEKSWGLDNVQVRVSSFAQQSADLQMLPLPYNLAGGGWELANVDALGMN